MRRGSSLAAFAFRPCGFDISRHRLARGQQRSEGCFACRGAFRARGGATNELPWPVRMLCRSLSCASSGAGPKSSETTGGVSPLMSRLFWGRYLSPCGSLGGKRGCLIGHVRPNPRTWTGQASPRSHTHTHTMVLGVRLSVGGWRVDSLWHLLGSLEGRCGVAPSWPDPHHSGVASCPPNRRSRRNLVVWPWGRRRHEAHLRRRACREQCRPIPRRRPCHMPRAILCVCERSLVRFTCGPWDGLADHCAAFSSWQSGVSQACFRGSHMWASSVAKRSGHRVGADCGPLPC